jgi:hypothetical protein
MTRQTKQKENSTTKQAKRIEKKQTQNKIKTNTKAQKHKI